jgi:tRNA-dihydrouridine synthase
VDDADWPDGYKLQVTTMTVKFRSGVRAQERSVALESRACEADCDAMAGI